MLQLIVGTMLVIGGVVVFTAADKLSAFEKRLVDTRPWTRVTGWSGTRRGVLAWRVVGILILLCGAVWIATTSFR